MNRKNLAFGILGTRFILLAATGWLIISALFFSLSETVDAPTTAPKEGFLAPDFTLQDLNGQTYTLSELRGHPVLLNFWATWCPPCRAEMPAIGQVYQDNQSHGLIVLAVTADDSLAEARQFAQEYALPFPVLVDASADVARAYNINSLPTSFFIKPDGVIQGIVIGGPMSEASIRARIEALQK